MHHSSSKSIQLRFLFVFYLHILSEADCQRDDAPVDPNRPHGHHLHHLCARQTKIEGVSPIGRRHMEII